MINKKEHSNLENKEIQDIYNNTNQTKPNFNMIWLMETLKIFHKEQLLIRYCVIKYLILLKMQNMIKTNEVLL